MGMDRVMQETMTEWNSASFSSDVDRTRGGWTLPATSFGTRALHEIQLAPTRTVTDGPPPDVTEDSLMDGVPPVECEDLLSSDEVTRVQQLDRARSEILKRRLVARAEGALRQGDECRALGCLTQAQRIDPDDVDLCALLKTLFWEKGWLDKAAACLQVQIATSMDRSEYLQACLLIDELSSLDRDAALHQHLILTWEMERRVCPERADARLRGLGLMD